MTNKQYERWKDFSLRMAAHAFPGRTERRLALLKEEIERWFALLEWDNEWRYIGSWDDESVAGRCLAEAEAFWDKIRRGTFGMRTWHTWHRRRYCVGDDFTEFFDQYVPHYEDYDKAYDRAHFLSMLHCCIRAGLDVASEPSAGVVGFTIGDLKRMYDGTIPEWICEAYEADLNAAEDDKGVWL